MSSNKNKPKEIPNQSLWSEGNPILRMDGIVTWKFMQFRTIKFVFPEASFLPTNLSVSMLLHSIPTCFNVPLLLSIGSIINATHSSWKNSTEKEHFFRTFSTKKIFGNKKFPFLSLSLWYAAARNVKCMQSKMYYLLLLSFFLPCSSHSNNAVIKA